MRLVERRVMSKNDPRYTVIDEGAFKSKNLYNAALYAVRQAYIHEGRYLPFNKLDKLMQSHEAYKALPAKVSQQILRVLDRNWTSFFEARAAYEKDPSPFLGRPGLPKYKDKANGRNILVYTLQALIRKGLKRGLIQPSGLPISIKTRLNTEDIAQVRIIQKTWLLCRRSGL
jgi:putative transposase